MGIKELEKAVANLPQDELARFAAWFDAYRQERTSDAWDRQVQADAEAGRLDELIRKAREEHRAGKTTPLP